MTRDRPTPPADLDETDRELLTRLEDRDPDRLRAIGSYLESLAAWKEANDRSRAAAARNAETNDTDETAEDGPDDVAYPDDVPERANVVVTEIAGTTYHYYQWREGDRIESKTVAR